MISRFNYALLAFAAIICVALYNIKYDALEAERAVSTLARDLAKERQELRLLQAEWAVRTEPQRLERLTARYLSMEPTQARQIVSMRDLPLPGALEPLYAQTAPVMPRQRPGKSRAVLATLDLPLRGAEPSPGAPLPPPQPAAPIPDVMTLPVIPRKRPFSEGR